MQVPSNLVMNTVPTPRLYLALVTVIWGLISTLTAVGGGHPTPVIHALKLSPPTALSRFLPYSCLPFLLGFRRQVGSILLPTARSDGQRRGRVLSRRCLLPLAMVHQEGSRLQDRSVRIVIRRPRFPDLRPARLNVGNMIAQGLGGLVAAGVLSGMEGARGIRGWRWVCSHTAWTSAGSWIPAFHH